MAIQNRRGAYGDFDPSKMVPGEFAVVQSNDPNATDGKSVYLAFAAGDVKRLATHDDMVAEITDITEDIIDEVSAGIEEAIHDDMETASAAAETATQKAADASDSAEEAAQTVATIIDNTLSQSGKAADAQKTGLITAPQYSTSATYNVGDYVIYSGSLYRCTTKISTAESWTSGHWTAAKVGSELSDLKSALYDLTYDRTFAKVTEGYLYARFDFVSGKTYKITNNTPSSVSLRATPENTGDGGELISSSLASGASIEYTATNDRPYLRIYFNAAGTVYASYIGAEVTVLNNTSPYHKLRYKYDAKALGGNTDDDVALQNYINDETYVNIPAGTYYLHKPLVINKVGRVLEGDGQGMTCILRPYDSTVTALINASPEYPQYHSLMMNLKNLCFQMVNYDGTFNQNPAIISTDYVIDSKIENCWFNGGNTSHPLVGTALRFCAIHTMILGCWFEMFDTAVEIVNGDNVTTDGLLISNCTFWNNKNQVLANGYGSIRGCTFEQCRGGFIYRSNDASKIALSDCYIGLYAPGDLDTTIYTDPCGIVFDINDSQAETYIHNIELYDFRDASESLYEYMLNAPSGKVVGSDIYASSCEHMTLIHNTNSAVNFVCNPLENVCKRITYNGNRAVLEKLLRESAIDIVSDADTTAIISGKNLVDIEDATLSDGGYLTTGSNHRQPILLPEGSYKLIIKCSNFTEGRLYAVTLYDSNGDGIATFNPEISQNISYTFQVPSGKLAEQIRIYANSPGSYSDIMVQPTEIENTDYEECSQRYITLQEGKIRRITQNVDTCIITAYAGTMTVNAYQTPV